MKHLTGLVSIIWLLSVSQSVIADNGDKGTHPVSSIFDALFSLIDFNRETIDTLFSGNGSAGPLVVASTRNFSDSPPNDFNFSNVTIESGQKLTVPAGTTIRCTGIFRNFGTIIVETGAKLLGARRSDLSQGLMATSHPGDSYAAPNAGMYSNVTGLFMDGGRGGEPIPQAAAISSFNRFRIGGGAGGGGGFSSCCVCSISSTSMIS